MLYRLVSLHGQLRGQQVTVEKSPMTIGRSPECSVVLDDEEVALKHATIQHQKDGLFITDLGSMNRILVNKREVREARLRHGDIIEIGRARFLVQAKVQAEVQTARITRQAMWVGYRVAYLVALLALVWGGASFCWWAINGHLTTALAQWPQNGVSSNKTVSIAAATGTKNISAITSQLVSLKKEVSELQQEMELIEEAATPTGQSSSVSNQLSSAQRLCIQSVDQRKHLTSGDFEEMRSIKISIAPVSSVGNLDIDAVWVDVTFFDEDKSTGEITISGIEASKERLGVEGPWAQHESKILTSTYSVPTGYREQELHIGRQTQYYGFIVRLYYFDTLQDEYARPKSLLSVVPHEDGQKGSLAGKTTTGE